METPMTTVAPMVNPSTKRFKVWLFVMSLVMAIGLSAIAHAQVQSPATGGPMQIRGGLKIVGSTVSTAVGTPAAPVVTGEGTAGSTSYTYYCVGSDLNGNDTIPSSSTVFTTGNASLSTTNFNFVQCGGQVGAFKYKILKADTAHIYGSCVSSSAGLGGSCGISDTGGAGTAYTAQTVDQTGGAGSSAPAQHALVRQTSGLCSTSGGSNAVCGEPTITGLPFADTNYTVSATCIGTPTTGTSGGAIYVVKAAASAGLASNAQGFISSVGQGTFSCAEIDYNFWHD